MTIPGASMAVFANSGQICSAGTQLFVEQRIYDEFVGRAAEFARNLKVGNGINPETRIGLLISSQQLERVTGYLAQGKEEGTRPVVGMDTNIVGTVNPAHLEDNMNALLQGPLPPAVYVEAKRRVDAAGSAPQGDSIWGYQR